MTVRAVLIGAAGYATGSIIAGKIENRVPDVRIVSILSVSYTHLDVYKRQLHSGSNGFSKRFWTVKEQKADEITFEIEDADLELSLIHIYLLSTNGMAE